MAQLDIVFSTEALGKYTVKPGGMVSARGAVNLAVTFAGDNGEKYSADTVTGDFYADGVLAKFVSLPPRNVPLRRISLRGMNVPPIKQIYWVEGREKLSGEDENLAHCEKGKCGWREAMDYCRSRGGRLLRLAELRTMYSDECAGRELEECGAGYWSSNEYAAFPRKAWYMDFSDGESVSALKSYTAYVRCIVPAKAVYKSKK
jgi:hypothetical protein